MGLFDHFPYTNFHELNLQWILCHFTEFIKAIDDLEEWKSQHEKEYEELKKLYDDISAGHFPPGMYNAMHDWVVNNSTSIIGSLIKTVFFCLEDGYLVAYIPDSWSDLVFGTTGLDDFPSGYEFGHLTITYQ